MSGLVWLLNDFDLLSTLLHAITLSLEALLAGGVFFLIAASHPSGADEAVQLACRRMLLWVALAMCVAQSVSIAVETALVVGNSGMPVSQAIRGGPLVPEMVSLFGAITLLILVWIRPRRGVAAILLALSLTVMSADVALSHAASRMDHRAVLMLFTGLHHLGTAGWIGAMPFLLVALKRVHDPVAARIIVDRFSRMAIVSVALLVGAGIGMSYFYIGSFAGLYGTSYGVLVMVKVCLLLLILLLGVLNWYAEREIHRAPARLLLRIRRFAEIEIVLGFAAILTAAALTAQAPAVDMPTGRATPADIYARLHWTAPRLKSPPFAALTPATPIGVAVQTARYQPPAPSDANDMLWSEYNHHWAGLVVLVAGLLAWLSRSRRMRWARFWPAAFAGLAVFILLRADPENWPLGPRPFWGSFFAPDVLEHRVAALLVLAFATFECAVQAGRLRVAWAQYAFPLTCVVGSAVLLTHGHSLGADKDETLVQINHALLALFSLVAGCSRGLELRLSSDERSAIRFAGCLWPISLMAVGFLLLDYREM